MCGNVAEWTLSDYAAYPYREKDGRNAIEHDKNRFVRGGSWRDRPFRATSSSRLGYPCWQRVYREYERGVVFRLGRFNSVRGPGLFFLIPIIETILKVDIRILTLDVPSQDVITKDNVPIKT